MVLAPLVPIAVGIGTGRTGAFLIGILIVMPLALLLPCRYTVTEEELVIRCGVLKERISLKEIVRVFPASNPLSAPALSLRRVQIDLRKGFRLVSPVDREKFIREIEARVERKEAMREIDEE